MCILELFLTGTVLCVEFCGHFALGDRRVTDLAFCRCSHFNDTLHVMSGCLVVGVSSFQRGCVIRRASLFQKCP